MSLPPFLTKEPPPHHPTYFKVFYKIMVFRTAVLDVIFVSSECDHMFDFPSGADNTDTSPNEESVQR